MTSSDNKGLAKWAYFRFSIIGGLLANPPRKGELRSEIELLAEQRYRHPEKDEWITFGASTIERWYYKALGSDDPIAALGRKVRSDAGANRSLDSQLVTELKKQYTAYPHWSYRLHFDNLKALVAEQPRLADLPSYSTILRGMRRFGWVKKQYGPRRKTKGQLKAAQRLDSREVRGFESEYVHALWHLDFHSGRRVVDSKGNWHTTKALCILDDRSRLCCHIQWYLDETADSLIHGLSQAFFKRGLPRGLMTDNGAAMTATEVKNGLARLGIKHELTLPYSPYQNGKQESFWGQLEGRLMAMLTRVESLTLGFLNKTTQAWVEQEYNRTVHEETRQTPLARMLKGPDVSRPAVSAEELRFHFTVVESRTQRASDGTLRIQGVRFEVPSRFKHIKRLKVGYLPSDLSMAYLVDGKTLNNLGRVYPQDKTKNANRDRRTLDPVYTPPNNNPEAPAETIPPLLRKLLSDYAATGLPPAYLPKEETAEPEFNPEEIF